MDVGADLPAAWRDGAREHTAAEALVPGPRLVARGLSKSYGRIQVLRNVDLSIDSGCLVVVAGANGAGKSTLLRCLAGTIRHEGSVLVGGRPTGRSTGGRVSYLPQDLSFPQSATGLEILDLFRQLSGAHGHPSMLPDGYLPDLTRPVGKLSGGQVQRIALAATLIGGPDLILLDEPFANLDDDGRVAARDVLREHAGAGATVIVASPSPHDLSQIADRLLEIRDGSLAYDGPPERWAADRPTDPLG
jgi:ABC-type multidrug transport system ATPase subunit